VIIVKRLPRYDRSSKDIIAIKSKLSIFANQVYDQLWLKHVSPARILLVELPLGCEHKYDVIHLAGQAALRHFTYRAVQTLLPFMNPSSQTCPCTAKSSREKP
jgi:hypothetical protein